jgi:hypothetical protein
MQNAQEDRGPYRAPELSGFPTLPTMIMQGLWSEPSDCPGIDWNALFPSGTSKPDQVNWPAYAVALLYTHRGTVKSLMGLHRLMEAHGYKGGRTALYSMEGVLAAAEGLGIYTPNKKTRTPKRGYRTSNGSIEAIDDHD